MSDLDRWIPQIIITAVGVLVGPWIAVKLSLRQFHSQKWWERKAEAYSATIEHLATIENAISAWIEMDEHTRLVSPERNEVLRQEYTESLYSLRKSSSAGVFLIAEDAAKSLEKLLSQLETPGGGADWHRQLEEDYDAVHQCVALVSQCAHRDLRVLQKQKV